MTGHRSEALAPNRVHLASTVSAWRSPDGAAVTIRPTRPSDAGIVQQFVRELSPRPGTSVSWVRCGSLRRGCWSVSSASITSARSLSLRRPGEAVGPASWVNVVTRYAPVAMTANSLLPCWMPGRARSG
jgi:hypothetical protein